MRDVLKNNAGSLFVTLGVTALAIALLPDLPEIMATKFHWNGEPARFMNRGPATFLIPGLMLCVTLLIPALIRVSPRGFRMEQSNSSVARMTLSVVAALAILELGILGVNRFPDRFTILPFLHITCVTFLIAFGNFLSKTERNFFIGIRTPWTIASEANWRATHRFAAKTCVGGGLFLLAMTWIRISPKLSVAVMIAAVGLPVFYSFYYYRRYEAKAG